MRRSSVWTRLPPFAIPLLLVWLAQSASAQPKPHFAVASIHENKSTAEPTSNVPLDRTPSYAPTGGVFRATNQSLLTYILFAYNVGVRETTTPGGFTREFPEWALRDKFDITARSDSPNPTKEDMRLMLRSLLEERFKLAVHRETRTAPVFALTLIHPGKTGPQLKPHDPASPCPAKPLADPRSIPAAQAIGTWPATCGDGQEIRISAHLLRDGGRDMTLDAIASWLTGAGDYSDRPIIDETGLKGTYDFLVVTEFAPEIGSRAKPDDLTAAAAPNLPGALDYQLGLRLHKKEGNATFFTVDHVEYPSAN